MENNIGTRGNSKWKLKGNKIMKYDRGEILHRFYVRDRNGRFASLGGGGSSSKNSLREKTIEKAYSVGAKIAPRELRYSVYKQYAKRTNNGVGDVSIAEKNTRILGKLTTDKNVLKAIEREGIKTHSSVKYYNMDDADIKRLKKYTDSARYSRSINGYLAVGEPKTHAERANLLKETLRKNSIDNQVVYRSCSMQFTTKGLGNKSNTMGNDSMKEHIEKINKNFKGKTLKENRIYSTSTSPLFAIDTWRSVNPTAASTYNTYMVINCKKTPGIYADATNKGKKIVNTRSNQECILAPNKMKYKRVSWDDERNMFVLEMDAM